MPKISKRQKMNDELKVMAELKKHPSFSVQELSERLGFSKSKVYKILRKFNNKKDQGNLGLFSVNNSSSKRKFLILAKKNSKHFFEEPFPKIINTSLKNYSLRNGIDLDSCIMTNGLSDWIFCISTDDILRTMLFCKFLKNNFQDYILDIQVVELLRSMSMNDYEWSRQQNTVPGIHEEIVKPFSNR